MDRTGGRVLVLEPDPDLAETITWILQDAGFEVEATRSFEEAEEELARRDYALVLADHPRPDADGLARLVHLRDAAAPVPLGVLTAWRDGAELPDAGFAFIRGKPLALEELLGLVTTHAGVPVEPSAADLIHRYFDVLTRREYRALRELCAVGVRYHLPGSDPTFARAVQGVEEFVRFSEGVFASFPDTRFTVTELIGLPSGAVARYRGSWRGASGERLESDGAVLFRTEGGRIAEIGVRLDLPNLRSLLSSP